MEVIRCRYCGKLFQSAIKRTSCEKCRKLDEEKFEQIKAYLERFPNSNAMQVAEGLHINIKEVMRFINEGWMSTAKPSRW